MFREFPEFPSLFFFPALPLSNCQLVRFTLTGIFISPIVLASHVHTLHLSTLLPPFFIPRRSFFLFTLLSRRVVVKLELEPTFAHWWID